MYTKIIVAALGALIVIGGIVWATKRPLEAPTLEVAIFLDPASEEAIMVSFEKSGDTAVLSGAGYAGVVLTRDVAASGARYVNEELGLELWNKGDEVTLSVDEEVVFMGVLMADEEDAGAETDVPPAAPAEPTAPVENGDEPVSSEPVASAVTLTTQAWAWKELVIDGEVITPNKPELFALSFDADGRVSGKTDCNGFGGEYTLAADGALSFGPFMSTLMYCEGSQENVFSGAVAAATAAVIEGNTLTLTLPNGTAVFVAK